MKDLQSFEESKKNKLVNTGPYIIQDTTSGKEKVYIMLPDGSMFGIDKNGIHVKSAENIYHIAKNIETLVSENLSKEVSGTENEISGQWNKTIKGNANLNANGTVSLKGSIIHLNSGASTGATSIPKAMTKPSIVKTGETAKEAVKDKLKSLSGSGNKLKEVSKQALSKKGIGSIKDNGISGLVKKPPGDLVDNKIKAIGGKSIKEATGKSFSTRMKEGIEKVRGSLTTLTGGAVSSFDEWMDHSFKNTVKVNGTTGLSGKTFDDLMDNASQSLTGKSFKKLTKGKTATELLDSELKLQGTSLAKLTQQKRQIRNDIIEKKEI